MSNQSPPVNISTFPTNVTNITPLTVGISSAACAGINQTVTKHCCTVLNCEYVNLSGLNIVFVCLTDQFLPFQSYAGFNICKKANDGATLKTKMFAVLLIAAIAAAPGYL